MTTLILVTAHGTIEEVLSEVAEIDNDFIGENGDEYLWPEAIGYDSNKDYLLGDTVNLPWKERVDTFLSEWLDNDCFYDCYKYSIDELDDGYYLSLAVVHLG